MMVALQRILKNTSQQKNIFCKSEESLFESPFSSIHVLHRVDTFASEAETSRDGSGTNTEQ
jgi:hypothetical protein